MIALNTTASNIRQAAFISSSNDILIKKIPYFVNIACFEFWLIAWIFFSCVHFYQLRKFLSIALIFIDYVNLYRLRESLNLYQSRKSLSIFKSLSIAWIFINRVNLYKYCRLYHLCLCYWLCYCYSHSQFAGRLYKTLSFWFGPLQLFW